MKCFKLSKFHRKTSIYLLAYVDRCTSKHFCFSIILPNVSVPSSRLLRQSYPSTPNKHLPQHPSSYPSTHNTPLPQHPSSYPSTHNPPPPPNRFPNTRVLPLNPLHTLPQHPSSTPQPLTHPSPNTPLPTPKPLTPPPPTPLFLPLNP